LLAEFEVVPVYVDFVQYFTGTSAQIQPSGQHVQNAVEQPMWGHTAVDRCVILMERGFSGQSP